MRSKWSYVSFTLTHPNVARNHRRSWQPYWRDFVCLLEYIYSISPLWTTSCHFENGQRDRVISEVTRRVNVERLKDGGITLVHVSTLWRGSGLSSSQSGTHGHDEDFSWGNMHIHLYIKLCLRCADGHALICWLQMAWHLVPGHQQPPCWLHYAHNVTQITFNTLRPRQNGRHFPDDIFKCIFLNENI